jgi:aminoglycoside 3-N-acetyltransferase
VASSSEAAPAPEALLEQLGAPRDGILYVQSSADWIGRAGIDGGAVLPALVNWIGQRGTLVMPSYPFHTTHQQYLESAPTFDVRKTPSAIGLLPEMLRRTRGVVRSLDPDFCVAALGPDAAAIAGGDPSAPDPFGPSSSYQRMLDRGATLLGLGVSENTTSFIHAIDSRAEAGYPSSVYAPRSYSATVIDGDGNVRAVPRRALRPEFQGLSRPSAVIELMKPPPDVYTTFEIEGARFFRWSLAPWAAWCLAHATARARERRWPCWLDRLVTTPVSVN